MKPQNWIGTIVTLKGSSWRRPLNVRIEGAEYDGSGYTVDRRTRRPIEFWFFGRYA